MRICLLVADASRARIFTYERLMEPDGPHERLNEERDLINVTRRQRPHELFADNSGGNHVGARGFAFDDHRTGHIDQLDDNFASDIVSQFDQVARDSGSVHLVIVASPRMLGELRSHLAPLRRQGVTIEELDRDFTQLTTAALRTHLANEALLPTVPAHQPAMR